MEGARLGATKCGLVACFSFYMLVSCSFTTLCLALTRGTGWCSRVWVGRRGAEGCASSALHSFVQSAAGVAAPPPPANVDPFVFLWTQSSMFRSEGVQRACLPPLPTLLPHPTPHSSQLDPHLAITVGTPSCRRNSASTTAGSTASARAWPSSPSSPSSSFCSSPAAPPT